jgi:hypothetical protein
LRDQLIHSVEQTRESSLRFFREGVLTVGTAIPYIRLTNEDGGAAGRRRLNCLSAFLF